MLARYVDCSSSCCSLFLSLLAAIKEGTNQPGNGLFGIRIKRTGQGLARRGVGPQVSFTPHLQRYWVQPNRAKV
ncbi:hypothetical protein BDP55DRAFT_680042, partial [Colletotrichum godetiae]